MRRLTPLAAAMSVAAIIWTVVIGLRLLRSAPLPSLPSQSPAGQAPEPAGCPGILGEPPTAARPSPCR
jgi:hypothetical protein